MRDCTFSQSEVKKEMPSTAFFALMSSVCESDIFLTDMIESCCYKQVGVYLLCYVFCHFLIVGSIGLEKLPPNDMYNTAQVYVLIFIKNCWPYKVFPFVR